MKFFNDKGPTNSLILLTLVICLIGFSAFGIKFIFLNIPVYDIPTIPYPQSSTKLTFSLSDFREQVSRKPVLNSLKAEALKVRGQNAQQVFENYKTQLEQDGWSLAHNENWYYFRKNSKSIAVSTTLEDMQGLDYLAKIAPNLQTQMELNDVLIIIVHGPYQDLLQLEY